MTDSTDTIEAIDFKNTIRTLTRLMVVANWVAAFLLNEDAPEPGLASFQSKVAEAMLATTEELLQQFPESQRFERFEQSDPVEIAGGRIGTSAVIIRGYLMNGFVGSLHQVASELWVAAANLIHASTTDVDARNEAVSTLSAINMHSSTSSMGAFKRWRDFAAALDDSDSESSICELVKFWWNQVWFLRYQLAVWNAMNGSFQEA